MTHARLRRAGFTLIELLLALALMLLLLGVTVPTFADMAQRQRLVAATEQLALELQQARYDAVQRGVPIYVSYRSGAQWCYAVSREPGCDCGDAAASCAIRRGDSREFPGVDLTGGPATMFDPALGGSTPGTAVGLSAGRTLATEVRISASGRAHACSVGAADSSRISRCVS